MGILVRQNENRTKLQEKLAAELREKAKQQSGSADPIDQTKHSNYVKDMQQTSDKAGLWFVLGGLLVIGLIVFVVTR